jgi:biotin transport system ATP-binding protein
MDKQPLFSLRGIRKSFPGMASPALDGASLDIVEGECLVIAGANGSGKTVLVKIALGLLEADDGLVLYRGESVRDKKVRAQLRREAGLVFQDPDAQFAGVTVEEDIAFGPENFGLRGAELEARVDAAFAKMGLEKKRDAFPRSLSGGEKRRLAVAGVLAAGCGAVFMDEPFANLDFPGVVQVLEIISSLKNDGKTVVVLTHELEKVLAFADRLAILVDGIVRDEGSPEEVLDRLKREYGVRDPRQSYASVADCNWLE